ncbi:MAG: hypothetical protein JWM75_2341, partial [Sphingomonas bacterium]|nr:hypothetical protein [Sphingomonas bacterium]
PAISRYGATSPELLRWFSTYNKSRSTYRDQVKPFGFLLSMSAKMLIPVERIITGDCDHRRKAKSPKPIAPFDRNFAQAVAAAFDRDTGEPVPEALMKTYAEALAQHHVHPESKFLNADYLDRGATHRRHVRFAIARHIGKESNDWERQAVLGLRDESQIDYGVSDAELAQFHNKLSGLIGHVGLVKTAQALGTTPTRLRVFVARPLERKAAPLMQYLAARVPAALQLYERIGHDRRAELSYLREMVEQNGLRATARALGIDPSNLRRKLG